MDVDSVTMLRSLLVSASGFLIGSTLVVVVGYFKAWLASRDDWRGLLPGHVAAVALSYNLLLVSATIEVASRIGNGDAEVTWRAFVLTPAYVLGLVAMYTIAKFRSERRLKTFSEKVRESGVQP